jgi:hypothetical protein
MAHSRSAIWRSSTSLLPCCPRAPASISFHKRQKFRENPGYCNQREGKSGCFKPEC